MNRVDKIITESIDKVIKENNFKSKVAKMRAAAHAAERNGDVGAVERLNDFLAKRAAIADINKEKRDSRLFQKSERIPTGIVNDDCEDARLLSGSRSRDARDYFNGEDEFNGAIQPNTFNDADGWLMNRNNTDELY